MLHESEPTSPIQKAFSATATMKPIPPIMLLVALILPFLYTKLSAEGQSVCSNTNIVSMLSSTYKSNVISLAKTLLANVTDSNLHSATGTAGTDPDKVYGAVLCRGDSIPGTDCANRLYEVLNSAIDNNNASSSCTSQKSITLFSDEYQAQLRFSDQDFISSISNGPECIVRANLNPPPVSDAESKQFNYLVSKLMEKLTDAAVSRPAWYQTGQGWLAETSQTVYGLVQCTQDMLEETCQACLSSTIIKIEQMVASGQMGGAILGVHCSLWYQTDVHFFAGHPMLSLHMPTPILDMGHDWIILHHGFCLLVACSYMDQNREKKKRARFELQLLSMAIQNVINLWRIEEGNSGFLLYNFSEIKEATDNFSIDNKLGQGGFGTVYKVYQYSISCFPFQKNIQSLLPGGLKVAVERLAESSVQGLLEFKNEIQLIAKLQHKNLVKLLGCCIQGDQEKMLVYEYMQNKSLDIFIFDLEKSAQLNWPMRLDLKASNILLDSDMTPKISDFGMARIFSSNMTESNTTRIVGTHGYISPEYAFDGVCSVKSDMFSFGVLILEIISGKRTTGFYPYDGKLYNLISYVSLETLESWRMVSIGVLSYRRQSPAIERCIQVALLCVQESADDRPAMDHVVTMLNSTNVSLPKPKQPAYCYVRSSNPEFPSCNITISVTLER
ncbi:hypothetical protein ACP4OV_014346 [Aristida adscensionis]